MRGGRKTEKEREKGGAGWIGWDTKTGRRPTSALIPGPKRRGGDPQTQQGPLTGLPPKTPAGEAHSQQAAAARDTAFQLALFSFTLIV